MAIHRYNYRVDVLNNAIAFGKVTPPFSSCKATYRTRGNIESAEIDGFSNAQIKSSGQDFEVSASGPANVPDMLTSEWDYALTIALEFSGIEEYNRPETLEVRLTDSNGEPFSWKLATSEELA